jgi:hypothetical protein
MGDDLRKLRETARHVIPTTDPAKREREEGSLSLVQSWFAAGAPVAWMYQPVRSLVAPPLRRVASRDDNLHGVAPVP